MASKLLIIGLSATSIGVVLAGGILQSPNWSASNAVPQTVEPRSCSLPPIIVKSQQTVSDSDWTQGLKKRRWQLSEKPRPGVAEQWITSLAFSPDGRVLASGSRYKEVGSKQGLYRLGIQGSQGLNGGVEIWRNLGLTTQWKKTDLYDSPREINAVTFNPGGIPLLAAGGNDKGLVGIWQKSKWNAPSSPGDKTVSHNQVLTISFSPNGQLLASGGIHGAGKEIQVIHRWDVRRGRLDPMPRDRHIQNVRTSQNSNLIQDSQVHAIAFSPDSRIIVGGGMSFFREQHRTVYKDKKSEPFVHFWEAYSGKYLCTIDHLVSVLISAVAFSPDGKVLATGDNNGTIKLWALPQLEVLTTLKHKNRVNALAFSPGSRVLLSASSDKTIQLWEIPTGKQIDTFEHLDEVTAVAFRPDGQAFATGSKNNVIQLFFAASQ